MLSADQLQAIMPHAGPRAARFLDPLNAAMAEFGIDTPTRQAAFLAQLAHESGELRYVEELASGAAYEGRGDLGNSQPGDGRRFKGRGLIQITGRTNYGDCSAALLGDRDVLLEQPQLLAGDDLACRSAAWYWATRKLNALADAGDFERITRRINGGLNGQAERYALWQRAQEVLQA